MNSRPRWSWTRIGILCAALALSPGRALANDWYVDASTGSDANDGQTPATAWRTLTHAMAGIPSLSPLVLETIHVAGGVYDAQLGEVFPLSVRPLTRLVGEGTASASVLDGGGASYVLGYFPDATTPLDNQTGADFLTLRGADTGVFVFAGSGSATPAFSDLRIRDTTGPGVRLGAFAPALGSSAYVTATFERLEVADCRMGILVESGAGHFASAAAEILLGHGTVQASGSDGIRLTSGGDGSAYAHLDHSRVVGNGRHGISSFVGGGINTARVTAESCLIAGNLGCGFSGVSAGSFGSFVLTDCTIAGNADAGIRGQYQISADLANCVVGGNGEDLDMASPLFLSAHHSISGDGDLAGQPGCLTADARFVDAALGDFRLRFESPCVETGDPAAAGRVDLLGHTRPYDGDLDTNPAPDMGAFEFEPLHPINAPHVGGRMRFEMWGPPGGAVRLWFTRAPLVAPSVTPYGVLYLDSAAIVELGPFALGSSLPRRLDLRVPDDPALVGTTFSFQSLTASSTAPQGWALSNPVSFVVAP
jgi:hypothetical protein